MFWNKSLLNSETLGDVWKLAHNIHVENIEKANLPNICNELNSLVTSESVKASSRLSLRASSNLIGGAAKLYKQSLDKLFDDVIKMNTDLINRRKRYRLDSSSTENTDSTAESSDEFPEEMRQSSADGFADVIKMNTDLINRRKRYRLDSSSTENTDSTAESSDEFPEEMRQSSADGFADSTFSPMKRIRTEPTDKMTPRITMSRSSSDDKVTNSNEKTTQDECSNDGNVNIDNTATTTKNSRDENRENDEEAPFSEEETPEYQRKDKGVQTSPILTKREKTDSNMENRSREDRDTNISSNDIDQGFDRSLPFGYILIHDNYNSRIPSQIIFTSINSDVNNLI